MVASCAPISLATRLVPWLRSWRAGFTSIDDVTSALTAAPVSGVEQFVAADDDPMNVLSLTAGLARLSGVGGDDIFLILPAPGHVVGLPSVGRFAVEALRVGEGIIAGRFGLVPVWSLHMSGSKDQWNTVTWRMFPVDVLPPGNVDGLSLGDADMHLTQELAEATERLVALDVARWDPRLGRDLIRVRSAVGDALPPGFTARASRIHARAAMLLSVLRVAESDTLGGAITATEAATRGDVLRGLSRACRVALIAACHSRLELS